VLGHHKKALAIAELNPRVPFDWFFLAKPQMSQIAVPWQIVSFRTIYTSITPGSTGDLIARYHAVN